MKVFYAGAHVGENISAWERRGFTDIIAIEPQKELADIISSRHKDIIVVNAALWDSNGEQPMYLGGYSSLGTLMKDRTTSGRFKDYGWDKEITVKTITLDHLIEKYGVPDVLQMDIEGAERIALKALSTAIDEISFEYVAEKVGHAVECARMLMYLDDYQFKIRIGESYVHSDGLDFDELVKNLKDISNDTSAWGMIECTKQGGIL